MDDLEGSNLIRHSFFPNPYIIYIISCIVKHTPTGGLHYKYNNKYNIYNNADVIQYKPPSGFA